MGLDKAKLENSVRHLQKKTQKVLTLELRVQIMKKMETLFRAYRKQKQGAIIEGLKHFGFGPHLSPLDRIDENYVPIVSNERHCGPSAGPLYKEVVEFNAFMVKWLRGQVPNTEESFQRLEGVIVSVLISVQ